MCIDSCFIYSPLGLETCQKTLKTMFRYGLCAFTQSRAGETVLLHEGDDWPPTVFCIPTLILLPSLCRTLISLRQDILQWIYRLTKCLFDFLLEITFCNSNYFAMCYRFLGMLCLFMLGLGCLKLILTVLLWSWFYVAGHFSFCCKCLLVVSWIEKMPLLSYL